MILLLICIKKIEISGICISEKKNLIDRYKKWRQVQIEILLTVMKNGAKFKNSKKNNRYKMLAWCQKILIEASIYYHYKYNSKIKLHYTIYTHKIHNYPPPPQYAINAKCSRVYAIKINRMWHKDKYSIGDVIQYNFI